jgi:hypothetical protein
MSEKDSSGATAYEDTSIAGRPGWYRTLDEAIEAAALKKWDAGDRRDEWDVGKIRVLIHHQSPMHIEAWQVVI